jgi:hypothetical protein
MLPQRWAFIYRKEAGLGENALPRHFLGNVLRVRRHYGADAKKLRGGTQAKEEKTLPMKTVLLITSNEHHRKLYRPGLMKYFNVEYSPRCGGGLGRVDALVYDIPATHDTIDVRWLLRLKMPVVVLTPEDMTALPAGPRRKVLTYPVGVRDILQALAELGVTSD